MPAKVKRTELAAPPLRLAAALALVFVVSGCGKSSDDSASPLDKAVERKPLRTAAVPPVPKDATADPSSDELIADVDAKASFEKPLYEQNQKLPTGAIRGRCVLRAGTPWTAASEGGPVDLTSMRDAMKGELDYYRKYRPPRRPVWAARAGKTGPIGVVEAFVVLENVPEGPRAPLQRGAQFNTLNGGLVWCDGDDVNGAIMKFATVNTRLRFAVFDPFPYHFVVTDTASGKMVWELPMAGHEPGWQRRNGSLSLPYHALGHTPAVQAPRKSSPVMTQLGRVYKITPKRHPWIEGYVILVSNPYVTRSSRHRHGHFTFGDVPVGRRTIRVWHPKFRPVKEVHDIEVRKDEITEIAIEFEPKPE